MGGKIPDDIDITLIKAKVQTGCINVIDVANFAASDQFP